MHDDQSILEVCSNLQVLVPALGEAVARDQGTADEERVSAASVVPSLPVNTDVLTAVREVRDRLPALRHAAIVALGEWQKGRPYGTPEAALDHIPVLHNRLRARGLVHVAENLAQGTEAVLRVVQLALGLRTLDRPLGEPCPVHDEAIVGLVTPGDIGYLEYDHLDAQGRPVQPRVRWIRTEAVLCRHCGTSWSPGQYLLLGRMIKEAAARRRAAREGEAA